MTIDKGMLSLKKLQHLCCRAIFASKVYFTHIGKDFATPLLARRLS